MNYTSSASTNINFSLSNLAGTAVPGAQYYVLKDYSYVPQGSIIYRLNMPLSINEEFDSFINDAQRRYREINNGDVFNISKANGFLDALKDVCRTMKLQPYIIFNKFSTKVQMVHNNKEFILDYDYEDLNTVFVISSIDGTLIVKENTLDKLEATLRSF